jgi:hypothetical protein
VKQSVEQSVKQTYALLEAPAALNTPCEPPQAVAVRESGTECETECGTERETDVRITRSTRGVEHPVRTPASSGRAREWHRV